MVQLARRERQIYSGYGGMVSKFAREWIVQTKGRWAGRALGFEPWQQRFVDELFLVYDDGERVYREALLGISRKNGKSTLSAAIALYMLLAAGEMGPEVYVAAGTKEQARIVFRQACEFVEASPRLRDWLTPQRDVIVCKANNGIMRVLSSEAGHQYGLNPSAVIIDELWVHEKPDLYYALTTGQLAREAPLVVSITTAGFNRQTICYELYERGVQLRDNGGLAAMRRDSFLFRWYEAPPTATVLDPSGWEAANPSSWIRGVDLEREAKRLPENVFRRLHLNQWTETEDAWIKPYKWDSCKGMVFIDENLPLSSMGVDVAFRRDAAAVTRTQWHGNRLHVKTDIMTPEQMGETFGAADIRGRVFSHARHPGGVKEVGFDPWSFRESAELLAEQGLPMVEFPMGSGRMGPASETLYELIEDQRIVHDGDRKLRNHVLSAVATPTNRGGWQISKRKSLERIDGCVSLAIAADRAVTLQFVKEPDRSADFF
jgi:phage terminase large subunit-like protein